MIDFFNGNKKKNLQEKRRKNFSSEKIIKKRIMSFFEIKNEKV
jgi:hypothetical protein